MKKKYSRILGVALALMLLASLFGFAAPVSAGNVAWTAIANPGGVLATGLNLANVDVGPVAVSPDGGTIFAPVITETPIAGVGEGSGAAWVDADADAVVDSFALLMSTDGGHNWTATGLVNQPALITGIAISPNFATDGTMYVASGITVFRSTDKGVTFIALKPILDSGGIAIAAINSIDMWPGSPAYVMVGTNRDVLVLKDSVFEDWRDQELGNPTAAVAVAFAPDFATTNYIWAVTAAGVVTTTNSPGAWGTILANTGALVAPASAVIAFPSDYSSTTTPYLWVAIDSGALNTGGVWRIRGLPIPGPSQAVKQYGVAPIPATRWDVRSLAVSGPMATATLIGGLQDAPVVIKSSNGGVTWPGPVLKQPTGGGAVFVAMAPDYATSNTVYLGDSAAGDAYTITGPAGGETGTITVTAGSVLVTPQATATVNGAALPVTVTPAAAAVFATPAAADSVVVTAMTRATTVTWAITAGAPAAVTTTDLDGDIYDTVAAAVIALGGAVPAGNLILLPDDDSEDAFQVSRDGGMSWNQVGLIDTPFANINDIAVVSRDTIFMVSDTFSLWKTDDATARRPVWERILTPITATIPGNALTLAAPAPSTINFVETSPNFLTDGVVYATNNLVGIMKAIDGGGVFAPMGAPATAISAVHVVDSTFAFVGSVGQIYRTDDGAYSWLAATVPPAGTVISIAESPNYATDGTLLVGNNAGAIYRSADRGANWTLMPGSLIGAVNTYVAFDPDATTTLYAGGGAVIQRLDLTATRGWENIDATMPTGAAAAVAADSFTITGAGADAGTITVLTGSVSVTPTGTATIAGVVAPGTLTITAGMGAIAWTLPAVADTLLVTSLAAGTSGQFVTGAATTTAAITTDVDGDATCGLGGAAGTYPFSLPDVATVGGVAPSVINGLVTVAGSSTLYASNALVAQGMERSLDPNRAPPPLAPTFERMNRQIPATATLMGAWVVVDPTIDVVGSKNVLFSIDTTGVFGVDRILTFTDTLATEVVPTSPATGTIFPRITDVTLEWETLTGALSYHWQIARDAAFMLVQDSGFSIYPTTTSTLLQAGQTYYWRVRVDGTPMGAPGLPLLSRWSEVRTFTSELGGRIWHPFMPIAGVAPAPGADDVILKPTFQWNGADWATSYELMLATSPDFTGATTKTVTVTAWTSDTTLSYSTTYYWKVRALSATSESEWSDVGVFTTMAEPEEAPPPVVVEELPAPQITVEVPPAEAPPTPSYIWAIIGIGAVLVIVVLVLIIRTRRPL